VNRRSSRHSVSARSLILWCKCKEMGKVISESERAAVNQTFAKTLTGASKVWEKMRGEALRDGRTPLTLKQVTEVLWESPVYAQTAPPPRESKVVYQSVVASENLRSVQYDLFFPARAKVPAWLSAIDVHSRKAFIVPMASSNSKRRTGAQIMAAMEVVTKEMGDPPQNINADQEFNRQPMLDWYKEHKITTHFSEPTQLHKNAVVERLHKTIKQLAL
jgi:hypothetical protein